MSDLSHRISWPSQYYQQLFGCVLELQSEQQGPNDNWLHMPKLSNVDIVVFGQWSNLLGPQMLVTWSDQKSQADVEFLLKASLACEIQSEDQCKSLKRFETDRFVAYCVTFDGFCLSFLWYKGVYEEPYIQRICKKFPKQLYELSLKVLKLYELMDLNHDTFFHKEPLFGEIMGKYIINDLQSAQKSASTQPTINAVVNIDRTFFAMQHISSVPQEFVARCISAHLLQHQTIVIGLNDRLRERLLYTLRFISNDQFQDQCQAVDSVQKLQGFRSISFNHLYTMPTAVLNIDELTVQCTLTPLEGFAQVKSKYDLKVFEYEVLTRLGKPVAMYPVSPIVLCEFTQCSVLVVEFLRVFYDLPDVELKYLHVQNFAKSLSMKAETLQLYIQSLTILDMKNFATSTSEASSIPSARPTPDSSPRLRPYTTFQPSHLGHLDLDGGTTIQSSKSLRPQSRNSGNVPAFISHLWPGLQSQQNELTNSKRAVLSTMLDLILSPQARHRRLKSSTDSLSYYMTLRLNRRSAQSQSLDVAKDIMLNDADLGVALAFVNEEVLQKLLEQLN